MDKIELSLNRYVSAGQIKVLQEMGWKPDKSGPYLDDVTFGQEGEFRLVRHRNPSFPLAVRLTIRPERDATDGLQRIITLSGFQHAEVFRAAMHSIYIGNNIAYTYPDRKDRFEIEICLTGFL